MSEGRTYVLVGVGAATLVALAALLVSRRADANISAPRVVTDDGQLEEIEVTARRISATTTTADPDAPRGIRNNNPGNLVYLASNAYRGQTGRDGALGVYDTAHNGIRAAALELSNDYTRKGLTTIDALITEWAPPHENPTVAYINAVSRYLNTPPNRTLARTRAVWLKLCRAVFRQENGAVADQYYTDSQISAAIADAGIP